MKPILIKLYFAVIVITAISACSTNKLDRSDSLIIKIDLQQEVVNIFETDLITDVQILNLDCDKHLFARIDKIVRVNNRIYLMDKQQTKSVVVYDTLGNFINLISKYGQGPDEYIQLSDIFYNADDSTLNIVSRVDKKLMKYDTDAKNLLSIQKLPKPFTNFTTTDNGYIGYMGNFIENKHQALNIWTLSKQLELDNSFLEINPTWDSRMFGNGYPFSAFKDTVFCILPLEYDIYSIKNGHLCIPYYFDFGNLSLPDRAKNSKEYDELMQSSHNEYITQLYYFQEISNYLIALTLYQGQYVLCIYNKNTSETQITTLDTYTDKYFFPFGKIIGIDEKAIYALIDASTIKRMVTGKDDYNDFESQYPEQIKRLRERFPVVDDEGNPFLVIYSIK